MRVCMWLCLWPKPEKKTSEFKCQKTLENVTQLRKS